MNNSRVVLKDGVDAKRVQEEYEYLGWHVKREGQTLTLSKKAPKKNDKKRDNKDSRGESREGSGRNETSDRPRGQSNVRGNSSRTTVRS